MHALVEQYAASGVPYENLIGLQQPPRHKAIREELLSRSIFL